MKLNKYQDKKSNFMQIFIIEAYKKDIKILLILLRFDY